MGPDFSIHGFDNGADGAFDNGAGSLDSPERSVFVVFRCCFARTSYHTSFFERSFLSSDPSRKRSFCKKKAAEVLFGRVYLCRSYLFFFDYSRPSQNSSVKIGFFVGEASQNALFRSKLGLLRKGLVITLRRAKKNGTFSGDAFLGYRFRVFRFR